MECLYPYRGALLDNQMYFGWRIRKRRENIGYRLGLLSGRDIFSRIIPGNLGAARFIGRIGKERDREREQE